MPASTELEPLAPRGLHRGSCTLIVARPPAGRGDADDALVARLERLARLPAHSLGHPPALDATEFRLIEGISREDAERLAAIATELGFRPRIQERLGIRWSRERGLLQMSLWFTAAALGTGLVFGVGFPLLATIGGPAWVLPALVVSMPAVTVGVLALWRWQLSRLYMPLVVDPGLLPPVDATEPWHDALYETQDALGQLRRAEERGQLPSAALPEWRTLQGQLEQHVERWAAEAAGLTREQRRTVEALQRQLEANSTPDDALEAAIAEASERADATTGRLAALVDRMLAVCAAATEARRRLESHDVEADPLMPLRLAVQAL